MGRKHQRPEIASAGDKRKRGGAPAQPAKAAPAPGASKLKFDLSKKAAQSSSDDDDEPVDAEEHDMEVEPTNVGDDKDSGELSEVSSAFDDEEEMIDSDDSSGGLLDEEDDFDDEELDEETMAALMMGGGAGGSDDEEGSFDDEEDDEDDMELEEGEFMDEAEEDEDDEDMVDDEYDTAQVNFDVNGMNRGDVDRAFHMFDSWIPDEMNFVDRDFFGEALVETPHTSLVEMGQEGGPAPTEDDNNVVGLVSLLDVARGRKSNKALENLYQLFLKPHVTVSTGLGIQNILVTAKTGKQELSKAVVLVNERVKNLPVELTSRLLSHTFETFDDDLKILHEKIKAREEPTEEELEVACEQDYTVVVMAKIQRSAESLEGADGSKQKSKADKLAAKAKKREEGGFQLDQFVFWREEDEVLYKYRDTRISAVAYKCRAQYDRQPEAEVPLSLLFAVSKQGVKKALAEIEGACSLPVQAL